ncbi:MAG: cytochrome c3 family protein [Nitrospirota bacterium]
MRKAEGGKKERRALAGPLSCALFVLLLLGLSPSAPARVTGLCLDCHTMHNSQGGEPVALTNGAAWKGGALTGDPEPSPQSHLLVTDCVGCHSSTGSETIVTLPGGGKVPIVYNQSLPLEPLAGGNFFWVVRDGDAYGHNVSGVGEPDGVLHSAPGRDRRTGFCADSCHDTLADPPSGKNYERGGCRGCHVFTYHHEDNAVYRFLKGHGAEAPAGDLAPERRDIQKHPDYVAGREHPAWEQNATRTEHNYYKGTDRAYTSTGTALGQYHSVSAFCAGCHYAFHGPYDPLNSSGAGSAGPWLRHPTDVAIATSGEYAGYDPITDYSVETPVAWLDPETPDRSEAVVMCLTCHRAHGSDQPELLRFDYDEMIAGSGRSSGCLRCHASK